jgi:hypothetical protein
MLDRRSALRPNSGEVAAKVIDGEAILIHLATGVDYSMDNVASALWGLIEAGASVDQLVGAVGLACQRPDEQVRPDVEHLLEQLLAEKLVLATSAPPPADPPDLPAPLSYVRPQLNIYRDMQDLLALDPPMPNLEDVAWKDPR